MTTRADNIISDQLAKQLDGERTNLLTQPNHETLVLIDDPNHHNIYDVQAKSNFSGQWLFTDPASDPHSIIYSQIWQQNPEPKPEPPTTPYFDLIPTNDLPELPQPSVPASTDHEKWLIGGMAALSMFALGMKLTANSTHHVMDQSWQQNTSPLAKPRAIVTEYSVAENPTAAEPRSVTQAEEPTHLPSNPTIISHTSNDTIPANTTPTDHDDVAHTIINTSVETHENPLLNLIL